MPHALHRLMHGSLRENVPLAPHTTIGLGGSARYFWECRSESELREALQLGATRRLPIQVLAGGSNMIFPDAGYSGLVVKIGLQGAAFQDAGDGLDVVGAITPDDGVAGQRRERREDAFHAAHRAVAAGEEVRE